MPVRQGLDRTAPRLRRSRHRLTALDQGLGGPFAAGDQGPEVRTDLEAEQFDVGLAEAGDAGQRLDVPELRRHDGIDDQLDVKTALVRKARDRLAAVQRRPQRDRGDSENLRGGRLSPHGHCPLWSAFEAMPAILDWEAENNRGRS